MSSGTYIRVLSEDIAKALGTVGCTISLRRTSIGKFNIGLPLDKLPGMIHNVNEVITSVEDLLDDIPVVQISDSTTCDLNLGKSIPVHNLGFTNNGCSLYLVKSQNGFLEIVELRNGYLFPRKLIRRLGGKDVD